ncbi:MAG: NUDIX hydrolase [Candidatus Zixiibacteriota bacterium]|nr:MAG: NUDIX hydrolase [candidate division Zixibacteria bacterium]
MIQPSELSSGDQVDLNEELSGSERVYDGKLLQVYRDVVRLADGHEEIREVIRHPGAAVVVPYLGGGRVIAVRQYRHPLARVTLEFPAGRLDPEEDPQDCARRELAEETGYTAGRWEILFRMHPAPGYADELLVIYLARDLQEGPNHPDEDEQVLVETVDLDFLVNEFRGGRLTDSKTVAALLYLRAFPETLEP